MRQAAAKRRDPPTEVHLRPVEKGGIGRCHVKEVFLSPAEERGGTLQDLTTYYILLTTYYVLLTTYYLREGGLCLILKGGLLYLCARLDAVAQYTECLLVSSK